MQNEYVSFKYNGDVKVGHVESGEEDVTIRARIDKKKNQTVKINSKNVAEKIFLPYLVLEVTRRCNMLCPHCLRGDAQDTAMSPETIDILLSQVSGIGVLTITGGEPLLAGPQIRRIVNTIINQEISIDGFYVATNGKDMNFAVINDLMRLYSICQDKDICMLSLSLNFHDYIEDDNIEILRSLSFFEVERTLQSKYSVMEEGRALENLCLFDKTRDTEFETKFIVDDYGDIESDIYINAKGYVYPECDMSYETQRKLANKNIKKDFLKDIIFT